VIGPEDQLIKESIVPRRKDTLQRDDPVQSLIRHRIIVGQVAPLRCNRSRGHVRKRRVGGRLGVINVPDGGCGFGVAESIVHGCGAESPRAGVHRVGVGCNLVHGQGYRQLPTGFAQNILLTAGQLAETNGYVALQIRQAEVACAVAAVIGAEQRK